MKLLLEYLKPHKRFITLALIIKTFGTLIELAIPYILSHILDNVVPLGLVRNIVFWGICMVLCAAIGCASNIGANRMAAKIAKNTTQKIRHNLFEKIMSLSPRQVDEFTIPSLESRLTSDTYNLHHFVGMSLRMGVRAPIMLIGGIIVTATLDPILTLVMVIVLPLISISVGIITTKGIPLFKKTQKSVDSMIRVVREDSQGIRVIKALSKTDYERRRYDEANKGLANDEKRASSVMAASNPFVTFFLNLGLVSVIVVGAFRVNADLSEPGKIIAFIQYFTIISMAMLGITRIFVNYSKGAASAARIEEVIRTESDLSVASVEDHPIKKDEPYIVFDDISFSYIGKKNNLEHISFSLEKGRTLGIIGATGSGKTTLIQLLMRFYDVSEGSIRIGGRDVRTFDHDELNTMFGVVMQNDFIAADTVRENIRFGREISDADIDLAATVAQAKEFISAYEDGYEHMLNSKGTNVSGGQKQRLLIARALAGKPDILVLDDSSSALDYKTDSNLRRSIRETMKDTTTIVVAQRVSSVMNSDLILVLDDGKVIGHGTHNELMQSCDVYREISDSQIGGAFLE
jgi:ATP-binding cassette subfamily B protein